MRSTLLFLLFPFFLHAQKQVETKTESNPIDQKMSVLLSENATLSLDTNAIKIHLFSTIENLKRTNTGLILKNHIISPKAQHYVFAQTVNGKKVFRGSVKINITNTGRVLSVFDHTFSVTGLENAKFPDHATYHNGLVTNYATDPYHGKLHHYNLDEFYFEEKGKLVPTIRLEVVENTDRYYEMVLNAEVRVIYQNDLLSYHVAPASPLAQDSTVTLWVFNPDPLTTANQSYGAPYVDNNDIDIIELNAERISVQMPAIFENGMFHLRNQFVSIEEFSPPTTTPTVSVTPEFNFTRSENGFEDVNAFYHISNFQQYIQSLGFNNIVNYPISVDAHGLGGSDNSSFNAGFNPPRITFGEGGVDDAEDADVVLHEYGHAIMFSTAPGTNSGNERRALDEAVGDYFASSYSRFLNSFEWGNVFSWDGHNEFWPGRSSISNDHYPEDLVGNLNADADIWSATLMQIWGDIGREATDAIMLQAAYSFSTGMSMPNAAYLFLQADTLLFNGANYAPIYQRMFDRGLIEENVGINENRRQQVHFKVFNSAGFAAGSNALKVVSNHSFEIHLYNSVGQLLLREAVNSGTFQLLGNNLITGVYLLKIESKKHHQTIKLVRH